MTRLHGLALATLLAACSGSPKQATPAPTPAARSAPTVRSIDLGHYRSADGAVGLILDRQDKAARVKLDGTTEVIELDGVRAPGRINYILSANRTMVEVHDDGHVVVYLPGRPGGIDLVRDGDVDLVSGVVTLKPADSKCCSDTPKVTRDQPPAIKLKLGHYKNDKRGIGLVLDVSTDQAKIKWDGTTEVIKLDQIPTNDRVDYIRTLREVVVQQWNDGRTEVWAPGAKTSIAVRRDGDADPL